MSGLPKIREKRVESPEGGPKEASTQIETEKKPEALNPPSVIDKDELRRQKNREYAMKYYWRNRDREIAEAHEYYQKNREKICAKKRERYHSDPEYREKELNIKEIGRERRREALRELKIALGGRCSVCGEDDLDTLHAHHTDGRRERARSLIRSKEFTEWIRHRIKPNVILLCANYHEKLHITKARGELDTP